MNNTVTLSPGATAFLDRVRVLLDDLATEDRNDVIQDLEAHLADLGESDIETALGSPEGFVAEFRASAGLDADRSSPRMGRLKSAVQRVSDGTRRTIEHPWARLVLDRAATLRPVWIWTRGWLAVTLLALMTSGPISSDFPVPSVSGSTSTGLVLMAAATSLSVWVEDRDRWIARWLRRALSLTASFVLVIAIFEPFALVERGALDEMENQAPADAPSGLMSSYGEVTNIYAYDMDGNPVEVLLYDQDGNPLSVSGDVYFSEETQLADTFGPVRFATDAYGQPIANLYPLDRLTWSDDGHGTTYVAIPPPRVPLPDLGDATENNTSATTHE